MAQGKTLFILLGWLVFNYLAAFIGASLCVGNRGKRSSDKERVFVIRVSLYSEFLFIQSNLIMFLYSFFLTPMKLIFKMLTTTNLNPIPFPSAEAAEAVPLERCSSVSCFPGLCHLCRDPSGPSLLPPPPCCLSLGQPFTKNPFKLSLTPNLNKTPKSRVPTMHSAPPFPL